MKLATEETVEVVAVETKPEDKEEEVSVLVIVSLCLIRSTRLLNN